MKHANSLDGIRALAVGLVMCFHFGYFAPGWVGVQIFFTLSGYLITGILLQARQQPFGAYLGTFYWHRALRILPLLLFFLAVCALTYLIFGVPETYGADWPWLAGFAANFGRLRPSDVGPAVVHIWSLAVEQQFYLLWPLLVYALPLRTFRGLVVGVLLGAPLLRFVLFQWFVQHGYDATYAGKAVYVLPFTQFDAFAAGALVPVFGLQALPNVGRRFVAVLGTMGVLGMAVLLHAYYGGEAAFKASLGYAMYLTQGGGYIWGYSVLNLASLLGLIGALQRLPAARFLEWSPLRWIGRISFGVYVYHVPLLLLGSALVARIYPDLHGWGRLAFFCVWAGAVILIADASFRWIETPFLKMKHLSPRRLGAQALQKPGV